MERDTKKSLLKALTLDPVADASVWACRSEDHHVYLTTSLGATDPVRGWAHVDDPYTFAIMAAAEASNRSVTFTFRTHDQSWGGGAGLFGGIYNVRLQGTGV